MNETSKFALVPRPSGALEKIEPRAKRLLSGMVADTLALAKPDALHATRIVILDDVEGVRWYYLALLESWPGLKIAEFEDGDAAWRELSRAEPDLFITDITHCGMKWPDMLAALGERKVRYPVLVISATLGSANIKVHENARLAKAPNLNVSFIKKPFLADQFLKAVEIALQIRPRRAP